MTDYPPYTINVRMSVGLKKARGKGDSPTKGCPSSASYWSSLDWNTYIHRLAGAEVMILVSNELGQDCL